MCSSVNVVKVNSDLVGRPVVATVHLLGFQRQALLDTGSQVSIVPLSMLESALKSGFDLDADVEEIPMENGTVVYDASGNQMSFKGAVRLTMQLRNGVKQRIACLVMKGSDEMLVLGTNALQKLGVKMPSLPEKTTLKGLTQTCHEKKVYRKKITPDHAKTLATVAKRVYLRPGETKWLQINCRSAFKQGIMWSNCGIVPSIVCGGAKTLEVPITNNLSTATLFKEGQQIGECVQAKIVEREAIRCHVNSVQQCDTKNESRLKMLL
ncbi:unnamed protein product, partial [Heligmosomoides polygyrus]|uniref:Peptidase A2 domain-containing protein n=1 Tax=Heligmosomoides polygyrus TaxID=6339 RepID=A0A183GXJ1_HELPZ